MEQLKRMRTINEALTMIKESDPYSSITYNSIKVLCKKGLIPSIKIGNRVLLNFDALLDYLQAR
ncbi:MAG: helix-turn-helix domain-containing protein [Acholeplasmatales bacterium]|nr:helix-turn-helix domain-containing protein [Acholeplasmatales bacterium]